MSKVEAKVYGLHFYPIKSCGETIAPRAEVTEKGFRYDRHWMVVDSNGNFLTQRELPRMTLIRPELDGNKLIIVGQGESSILEIPVNNDEGLRRQVVVWGNQCDGVDDGDIPAQWFSDYLGVGARLVHMPNDFIREKKPGYGRLEFADSYPFLIVSQESLQDLNERIVANDGQPVPMNRFRPNIVVEGCEPYAEDRWGRIKIGEVEFDVVKPCIRCPIPQVDQATSVKGKEPIKTLYTYRKVSKKDVIFAQKAVNLNVGELVVGQDVEVFNGKELPTFIE